MPTTNKSNSLLIVLGIITLVGGLFFWKWIAGKYMAPKEETVVAIKDVKVPDGKITLTVWAWNTAAKSLSSLVPDFNKIYPDITVKIVEIPYNEANNKFRQAVSSGEGLPDVWDSEGPVTEEYIKTGALKDITEWAMPYKNEFVAYKLGEVSDGSKIYALPWDTAPVAVFYRRDLFEKAGVKAEDIKTWDDYIAAGKKVTKDLNGDGKPDQYMAMLSKKADVQDTFEIFLAQLGGSLFDSKGNVSFNSKAGVVAVKQMQKMLEAGIAADIGWWSPEFFNSFKKGNVATYVQGAWLGGQIKENAPGTDGKWGVFPLPAVTPGGLRSAVNGGSNLAIPAKAKNPEAAWKFIEFAMAKKESQLKIYQGYNIFPALKSTYSDPAFNQPNAFFGNQKTSEMFISIQKEIPSTWNYGRYYNEVTNIISAEIVKALNGQVSAEESLKNAEIAVENFIKGKK